MSEAWKVDDAVWLTHNISMGEQSADWDEIGIIQEIDEEEEIAWIVNKNGDGFDIPLSELQAYYP